MKYPINHHKVKGTAKDLGSWDVSDLCLLVDQISEETWKTSKSETPNYNKKTLFLQKASYVTLKFTDLRHEQAQMHYHNDWAKWRNTVGALLEEVARLYGYEKCFFPIIMLAKRPPKCPIIAHSDGDVHSHAPHKIHIPLFTNEETFFYIEGERFSMKKGRAYEVDNIARHWVVSLLSCMKNTNVLTRIFQSG